MNRKTHLMVGIIGGSLIAHRLAVACLAAGHEVIKIETKGERHEDLKAIKGLKADVVIMDDPEAPKPPIETMILQAATNYEPPKVMMPVKYEPQREHWRRGRPLRKR